MDHAAAPPDLDSRKYRLRYWTLGVLSLSLLVIALDVTVLNVAIPTIQRDLNDLTPENGSSARVRIALDCRKG
ncbi:MAG: hypothetical protein O3C25_00835, partial [Chloroflexi bacterium]|nr:hypothetical protein [Chloroflexota bacterium]